MKVSIKSAVLYNGKTYFPDDSGFAEVPDEVAEALNLTKVTSSTVVENTSGVEDTGESGKTTEGSTSGSTTTKRK